MTAVTSVLDRLVAGERLERADALRLHAEAPLEALGEAAHARRAALTDPAVVTYLVDRNLNYTNACTVNCSFCAFYRVPGHPEAYALTPEAIGAKLTELEAWGGTRILMQGGHNPELPWSYYRELLTYLRRAHPRIAIDAFSPSEIDFFAKHYGMTIEHTLGQLRDWGLDGLPGGGGEILDDAVRKRVSPKKQRTGGWLEVMRIAQRLGLATTATMVIGFDETTEQRVNHLEALRAHQDAALAEHQIGFTAFIPWTLQVDNTVIGRIPKRQGRLGASYEEYLRHLAFSRLYLDNFAHVAASWPTQGEATAARGLKMGADDIGSTMMEENVVSQAGSETRARQGRTPAELRALIRQAGFVPAQRDTRYHILRRFDDPKADPAEPLTTRAANERS